MAPPSTHTFTADLWLANDDAPWHFVTLPHDLADHIAEATPSKPGFGSVRVEATIGGTTWTTSLFPDNKAQSYVLPIKKDVRQREQITAGDAVDVTIALADS